MLVSLWRHGVGGDETGRTIRHSAHSSAFKPPLKTACSTADHLQLDQLKVKRETAIGFCLLYFCHVKDMQLIFDRIRFYKKVEESFTNKVPLENGAMLFIFGYLRFSCVIAERCSQRAYLSSCNLSLLASTGLPGSSSSSSKSPELCTLTWLCKFFIWTCSRWQRSCPQWVSLTL